VGIHYVNITVYKPHYQNQSVLIAITVRIHRTEVLYEPPALIPWSKQTFITIYHRDLDTNALIPTSPNSILVNRSAVSIVQIGVGTYNVSVDSRSWGLVKYITNITLSKTDYDVSSAFIPVSVRSHYTSFVNNPVLPVIYTSNVNIYVFYRDLDNYSTPGINNLTNKVIIRCRITNPPIAQPNFLITDLYAEENGKYRIIFATSQLPEPRIYTIQINVSWILGGLYQNKSLSTTFEVQRRPTEFTYLTPSAVSFSNLLIIPTFYKDLSSGAGITNNSGHVHISLGIKTPILLVPAYRITNNSNQYDIIINTSSLPSYGVYTIQINISWDHVANFYEANSILVTFTVEIILTTLSYSPPGTIPWSSTINATILLTYFDIDHSIGISGARISLTCTNPINTNFVFPINWTYSYQGAGNYLVEISMDNLVEKTYTFRITANKSNYVTQTQSNINLTIKGTYTSLTSPESPSAIVPIGMYNITVYYIDRERGVNVGNDTAPYLRITFFTYDSNKILINNAKLIQIGPNSNPIWLIRINTTNFNMNLRYNLTIQANRTHYEFQELNITLKLRNRDSTIIVTNPASQVWGENVTFIVRYTDLEGTYVRYVNIKINWTNIMNYYSYVDNLDGTYTVHLNTSAHRPIPYILEINASAPGFTLQTKYVTLPIRPIDSQLAYNPPATTPWNETVNFWIEYTDVFHVLSINGSQIIIDCNISSGYWWWSFDPSIKGRFQLQIDSSTPDWGRPGLFYVLIDCKWAATPYYNNQTIVVPVNIRSRATELLLTPPESVVFGFNSTLIVQYRDLDNNTRGITNSSVWGPKVNITVWRDDGFLPDVWDSSDSFFGPVSTQCWIIELNNGQYKILINTSVINSIGIFKFWVWAN
jgi:hypothetical protein